MMSKEKRRVPKLRFPGFTEDWKPREFKNLFKKNLEKNNGKFKSNKTISIAKMAFNELGNGASEESLDNYKVLRIGDIAFEGHENKDFKFGRFVMNDIGNGIMSPRFTTLRPIVLLEIDFWKEYINYESIMQKKLVHSTKKGTMMHELVVDEFLKQTILVPPEKEQQHIGQLLKFLSKVISLQQRKLEHLNLKKKALLQKLFPKEGARYPELRFPGFTDAWEQRKLSEFVDKAVDNRGKTPPLDENGAHPLIEVAALGGVYPDYSKVEKYLSDDVFNTNLRAYIKKDDILFTTVGSIGLVSLMDSREEAAIAQNIVAFRAKENFLPEYLYALFSNEDNQYKAKRIAMVAVQPSIKVSQLVNVEYMISTNIEEQERIGVFFSSLQSLITLHQRKLEHLQLQKKALLQQIFV